MADLYHAAFVFIRRKDGQEMAMRAEAAVYAKNFDHAKEIIQAQYEIYHYESLYKMAVGTFILTSQEKKCPN